MAKNCAACDELKNDAPNLVLNGLTNTEIASLKNNTGFSPSNGNDDCTDLNNANDCLIGNMADEIDAYDVCDWKDYTKKFVNNVWTVFASVIAAICGLWTNIKNILTRLTKAECEIRYLYNGATFDLDETSDTGSYIVAGQGVSFLERASSGTSSDVNVLYIAGGLGRVAGSLRVHSANFTDSAACYNWDNNSFSKSSSRKGNSVWKSEGNIDSELVYEIRIKKSEYPQIKSIYSGFGQEADFGGFHVEVRAFTEGQYAFGQHGSCNTTNGNPVQEDYDRGHLVPSGYIYLQMRMTYIFRLINPSGDANQANMTPRAFIGMRMSRDALDC